MRISAKLRLMLSVILVVCSGATSAKESRFGSDAELWSQRSRIEKVAYLYGICQGLNAVPEAKAAELPCKPLAPAGKDAGPVIWKFCGALVSSDIAAVQIFDHFYQDKNHSDIPPWMVVVSYDDKMCGNSQVKKVLNRVQEKRKCLRQLLNLTDTPGQTEAARQAACAKLE